MGVHLDPCHRQRLKAASALYANILWCRTRVTVRSCVLVNYTKNDTHGCQSAAFVVSCLYAIWCCHLPLGVFCRLPSASDPAVSASL